MEKTIVKCDACGAAAGKNGKPFTQGTLNLHKSMHCPKKGDKQQRAAACCADPSYRLLTPVESSTLLSRGHTGYSKVCVNCQEVL